MLKRFLEISALTVLIMFIMVSSAFTFPNTINYQGKLTDPNYDLLNGEYSLTFKIYSAETSGEPLWTEEQTVTVINGIYNAELGAVNPFPVNLFETERLYMELIIYNEDTGADETLSPRIPFNATGYSMKAKDADSVTWSNITNKPAGFADDTDNVNDADADASNEIQTLSTSGNNITLSNSGGSIIAPYASNADKLDGNDSSAFATAAHIHTNYAEITHYHSGGQITSGTIPNERLDPDLQDLAADGLLSASRVQYGAYFIDSSGTSGQVWKSDGSGKGYWGTDNNTSLSESTVESYIANDVTTNYVPRNNGSKLVTGRIYDNGVNVGIGTSNPDSNLHIYSDSIGKMFKIQNDILPVDTTALTVGVYPFIGGTRQTRVGISTTDPSYVLHVNGSAGKPGGGSWSETSDERLKKNVENLTGALHKITQLQGITFEWINPEEHGNQTGRHTSLIAQDVEKVFPEWVSEIEPSGRDKELVGDGEAIKSLNFPHGFNAYIIEAVKELKAEIDELREENIALKAKIAVLEEKY